MKITLTNPSILPVWRPRLRQIKYMMALGNDSQQIANYYHVAEAEIYNILARADTNKERRAG